MTGGALAQFITKVKICDCQPAFGPVKQGEPPIQHHFRSYQHLIRSLCRHPEIFLDYLKSLCQMWWQCY
jgi:hypothetical protein